MLNSLTKSVEVKSYDSDFSFEASRAGLAFKLLRARTGIMVKLNLILAFFAVPAILAIYFFTMQSSYIGATMPYSAHFGPGYPVITNPGAVGTMLIFKNNMWMHLSLTGGIFLLLLAFSGAFAVMRVVARGEIVPVFKTYLIGVKKNIVPFLFLAPLFAVFYFLLAGGISAYGQVAAAAGLKIFLLVLLGLAALFICSFSIFYATMSVTFKIKAADLIKNSAILAVRLMPRNLIVLGFTALPFILLYYMLPAGFFSVIGIMLALAFLFSYIILIWTVYAHWAFHRFLEPFGGEELTANVVETTEAVPGLKEGIPALADAAAEEFEQSEIASVSEEAGSPDDLTAKKDRQNEPSAPPKNNQQNQQGKQKPSSAYKFKTKK